jgi:putative membrane protein
MMWYGYRKFPAIGGLLPLHPLLTIIFIILVVVILASILKNNNGTDENKDNALKILKERYAKGEIDKKTFEEMKKDIS